MDLPAHTYLDERNISYRRLEFSPDTEKGAASVAHALDFDEGQMVKTLLFRTSEGQMALVMLGGDRHAISGQLKRALGSRNISLADPELVKEITGYAVGLHPALPLAAGGVPLPAGRSLNRIRRAGRWRRRLGPGNHHHPG